jgi:hypothetical protein
MQNMADSSDKLWTGDTLIQLMIHLSQSNM